MCGHYCRRCRCLVLGASQGLLAQELARGVLSAQGLQRLGQRLGLGDQMMLVDVFVRGEWGRGAVFGVVEVEL